MRRDDGPDDSATVAVPDGAQVVPGEVGPGHTFRSAGMIWMPGARSMQPVDFSGREAIRFPKRGDGRQYSAILIGSAEAVGPPPTVTFMAPEESTQVEMRLKTPQRRRRKSLPGSRFGGARRWRGSRSTGIR